MEIIQIILSDNHGVKPEINKRKKNSKMHKYMEIKWNTLQQLLGHRGI
jgi:hypothetical protein